MLTIVWMSTRKNNKNEFESENLRKQKMPHGDALKTIIQALEKLKYKKYSHTKWSLTLYKSDPNQTQDFFLMTIVGLPEEIAGILANETVKKFIK